MMNAKLKNSNGSSQDLLTKSLGPSLKICQLNIEGISWAKCQVLEKNLRSNDIDVVAIQETHTENTEQLTKRGTIPGYDLLGAVYHRAYGVATYVRSNVENAQFCSASDSDNIQQVIVKIGDITINNIYKPPGNSWPPNVLTTLPHPAVYVGDFNSHHTQWKYKNNDNNGETLIDWSENNKTYLIFNAKDRGSFKSAAWNQEYNPDLCFVSTDYEGMPVHATRTIMSDFPHSQHRPAMIKVGMCIPLVRSFPRPRWNFRKARWGDFSGGLDKCLGWVPPEADNYQRFVNATIETAKKTIPRGYRKEYVPGWTDECEKEYQRFLESGDREIADDLLLKVDAARREMWTETVEGLDFKISSRKAWSLLRKLGGDHKTTNTDKKLSANKIATHIVSVSRTPKDRDHATQVKHKLTKLKTSCEGLTDFSGPFTIDDIKEALKDIKSGKAPGPDGIHSEFLLNCGKYTKKWLAMFFTDIMEKGKIPHAMKQSKIIAILKPGKPDDDPKSYRPIALLSMIYKLLERVLLNRIGTRILERVPIEQAGFRPKRSCTDQVMSLTTHIEAGFQKKLKTSAAFIDLSAAYDTVWRHGLLYKLIQIIPCARTIRLVDNMLANRTFQVVLHNQISSSKILNEGLPQGSVLAPLLFSLYLSDMPETKSRKFGYADDWVIATRHQSFEETEETLTADLRTLGTYFRKWRLRPNPTKTETSCFHLCNKNAARVLQVNFEGRLLHHNTHPKYLGVTLDRTLSYRKHLENTAAKLRTRNNILHKLCGTTWGSSANTLRTSAIGLVYSAAEYSAPVWINSAHTHRVDVQLNNTMRIVSGTLKSTPIHWLPVLSHIPPPDLRRKTALLREYEKIQDNPLLPIHADVNDLDKNRLRSRRPPMRTAKELDALEFNPALFWEREWRDACPAHCRDLPCLTEKPPAYEQPRKIWSSINRIRTGHGRCGDSLYNWGKTPSPACDCGAANQTVHHIVTECQKRAYNGNFNDFLMATKEAIDYICKLDVCL